MIYLATPYSDSNPIIREERYRQACNIASILATHAIPCYVPIAFWHPISEEYQIPGDADFWKIQDHDCLALSSELWIITMEGWHRSKGITMEREHFAQIHGAGKIFYYTPFEIASACEEYHERRNDKRDAQVADAMKTASAAAGTGSLTDVDQEHRKIIT